ncbi:uncharacterized protein LOC129279160 [Lytechinus pictus]|uniref:uncharacterized protein LOC129279160 n=1 Tax=Lytechinus pictus TaxID=7653 RepID=UPI0030B9CEA3
MSSTTSCRRVFLAVLAMSMVIEAFAGRTDPAVTALTHRVNYLQRYMTSTLMGKISNLESQNMAQANAITRLTIDMNETVTELTQSNAELRQKNAELQTMVGTFERFFSSLLVDNPDAFDPTRGVVERMDSLNAFLGNRQAMLAGLRPDPETVPTNDTVDQEALGRVLTQLSEVNSGLEQKVDKLQRRVDNGVEAAGDRALTGGANDILTLNQVGDKLVALEAAVSALTATQLAKDDADRQSGSRSVISERDRAILEGDLYGTARSVTSVRKSVFSVALNHSVIGTSSAQKMPFNFPYVNKGDHWNATSKTFVCGITGYYYFHFSLRSYDSHYMGVHLMKNNQPVTAVFTEKSSRNVMESQGVVLHLDIGDEIYLRLSPSTEYAVHSDTYKYCTFSGFLVYKGL